MNSCLNVLIFLFSAPIQDYAPFDMPAGTDIMSVCPIYVDWEGVVWCQELMNGKQFEILNNIMLTPNSKIY